MRTRLVAALCFVGSLTAAVPRADACGGFFCSGAPVDQNAERIVFSVDEARGTTDMVVQITYQGDDDAFAWVLPVGSVPTMPAAVADPEITEPEIADLTFFLKELAPPARDLSVASPSELARGEQLFTQIACSDCHVPSLTARDGRVVPLYSDLLLHDVGQEDYVGVADGPAKPREMRTPPLWGLRATAPYLHDGSASTVEQAIALHGREGDRSRLAYEQLDAGARAVLLLFLRSL